MDVDTIRSHKYLFLETTQIYSPSVSCCSLFDYLHNYILFTFIYMDTNLLTNVILIYFKKSDAENCTIKKIQIKTS